MSSTAERMPPRAAEAMARWACGESAYAGAILGDLHEEFARRAMASVTNARRWYWLAALSLALRFLPSRVLPSMIARDIAYAWRGLRAAPVFALVVVVTLAFGIGANTAVVGVIDTLYLRRLPVPNPERLVGIYAGDRRAGGRIDAGSWMSLDDFRRMRATMAGVSGTAAFAMQSLGVDAPVGAPVWSALVSGDYFDVLGVHPERGRFIHADEDDGTTQHAVVVISDHLWRSAFGARDDVLGQQVSIGRGGFTIVGVAPAGFTGLHPEGRTDLWMPLSMASVATASNAGGAAGRPADALTYQVFARLSPSATLARAQASADAIGRQLAEANPNDGGNRVFAVRVRDRLTTAELSGNGLRMFVLVWVVVALVHVALCTNVASLMLARAAARRREIGVRICLGASRARLITQSFAEAALLTVFGAVLGLGIARWFSHLLAGMQFLSASDGGLDVRVVTLVMAVSAATVLLFGVIPALDASRGDPLELVRGVARGRRRSSRSEIVVVAQIAVAVLLLADAAVFISLLSKQLRASPGFDVTHTAIVSVAVRQPRAAASDWLTVLDETEARIARVDGVERLSAAIGAPLLGARSYAEVRVPGQAVPANALPRQTSLQMVGPGYFATIGAVMEHGREFTRDDRLPAGARRDSFSVVIVNERLARRLWPRDDALGKQLSTPRSGSATVVGIVRDMNDVSTMEPIERAYFPLLESSFPQFEVVVRTRGDASASLAAIGDALDGSSMISRPTLQTMSSVRDGALAVARGASAGLALASSIALFLTSIGLYGLVAMWASRRKPEIAVRIALGARYADIHRLLLAGAGRIAIAGIAVGLLMSVALIQVERSWIGPALAATPLAIAAAIAIPAVLISIAAFIPARRAARQPPSQVLRIAAD